MRRNERGDGVHRQDVGEETRQENDVKRLQSEAFADIAETDINRDGVQHQVDGPEGNFVVEPEKVHRQLRESLHQHGQTRRPAGIKLAPRHERAIVQRQQQRGRRQDEITDDFVLESGFHGRTAGLR